MLAVRYFYRSIVYKNFIFFIGGVGEGQEVMSFMERYDSISNIWESMVSMLVGVFYFVVVVKD